jgi:alpha-L-fucosidase
MESWFSEARFGLFVHWSHSSQQGIELSWPLVGGVAGLPGSRDLPVSRYHASAATFDPRAYDPRSWARLARELGMTYAVLTAKHHDGFAMWDTKQSDFSVVHAPYGRDVVRAFVDAMRSEGLRVGLYFSLCDWHHPDYPAFTDADKPYAFGRHRQPTPEQWARFRAFLFAQVEELLTGYGPIDLLWFDGGWERSAEQWGARELRARIRALAPDALVNDRLPGEGDFDTPEQFVPPLPPARAWETCMTINETWGYDPDDHAWKSPRRLVHTLCEVAGKGGNLLLNVGPKGDGRLPEEIVARLAEVGRWMARHREAIVGTRPGVEPWQFYGPTTRRGSTLYLHCLMRPYDVVTLRGVAIRRVRGVRALGAGAPLRFETRCPVIDPLFSPDPQGELRIEVPESAIDPLATVLAVDVADAPLARERHPAGR